MLDSRALTSDPSSCGRCKLGKALEILELVLEWEGSGRVQLDSRGRKGFTCQQKVALELDEALL